MAAKRRFHITALWRDPEAELPRVFHQRLDQFARHPATADFGGHQGLVGHHHVTVPLIRQPPDCVAAFDLRVVFPARALIEMSDADGGHCASCPFVTA